MQLTQRLLLLHREPVPARLARRRMHHPQRISQHPTHVQRRLLPPQHPQRHRQYSVPKLLRFLSFNFQADANIHRHSGLGVLRFCISRRTTFAAQRVHAEIAEGALGPERG